MQALQQLAATAPAWLEVNSKRIAVLAYLRGNEFNMAAMDIVASAAYSQMTKAVREVNGTADLVIVWLHWGKSEANTDTQQSSIGRQRIFAHALIDVGADLVLCQQLHTYGGIELYNGKPIIYGLADFIYDTYSLQYARTIIPKVTFEEDTLKSIELIPTLVDNPSSSFPKPIVMKEYVPTKDTEKRKLGDTALDTLKDYQKRCAALKTEVVIEGERGWINSVKTPQ